MGFSFEPAALYEPISCVLSKISSSDIRVNASDLSSGLIGFKKISDLSYRVCCLFGTSVFLGPTLTEFSIVKTTPGTGSKISSVYSSQTSTTFGSEKMNLNFLFLFKRATNLLTAARRIFSPAFSSVAFLVSFNLRPSRVQLQRCLGPWVVIHRETCLQTENKKITQIKSKFRSDQIYSSLHRPDSVRLVKVQFSHWNYVAELV